MVNTQIQNFENNIIMNINESKLPPIVVELVLNKIASSLKELTAQAIQQEAIQMQKEQEQKDEEQTTK